MAVYKVAQDVEAEDHLLGPFTARQFIYLIIVAMAGAMAYFLSRILLPLMLIPMPVILFFGALALPLRKDQPMEVYVAAMISFYLKPRKRFWIPDGVESLVNIVAPRVAEVQRTKDFDHTEAEERLRYLADLVDTEGWAIRHAPAGPPSVGTSMISDVYNAAQATADPLATDSAVGQSLDSMIQEADQRRRQDMINRMHNPVPAATPALAQPTPFFANPYTALPQPSGPEPVAQPAFMPTPEPAAQYQPQPEPVAAPVNAPAPEPPAWGQPDPGAFAPATPVAAPDDTSGVRFNPYPTIHQSVIQPMGQSGAPEPTAEPPADADSQKSTSETTPSPDIIKLVSNSDLSIETMAREAHRIMEKDEGEEVVISLR